MPKLKTAEERAAEIRAQSAEIEAAQAAKAAEKQAEIDAEVAPKVEEKVDYKALAAMEEARAAKLKADADALQLELDPSLRPKLQSETEAYVKLDDIFNHPERSAQETLEALHAAIRKGRETAVKPEKVWPEDLSHLTPTQRERTLREMARGKEISDKAQAAAEIGRQARARQNDEITLKTAQLAELKAKLAEAEATIAVLRHNPVNGQEQFPTVDAGKVSVTAA